MLRSLISISVILLAPMAYSQMATTGAEAKKNCLAKDPKLKGAELSKCMKASTAEDSKKKTPGSPKSN